MNGPDFGVNALRTPTVEQTARPAGMVQARTAGDPIPNNDPEVQADYVSRQPLRFPLTLPVQNPALGLNGRQAGAGRPITPPYITVAPNQSVQAMPDGRIIARPMPTAGVDARQVIRPA